MPDPLATYRAACDRWSAAAPGTLAQYRAWRAMIRALLALDPAEYSRLEDAAERAAHGRRGA